MIEREQRGWFAAWPCRDLNFLERDCVRSIRRSAAAGLRHSRALTKLGHCHCGSAIDRHAWRLQQVALTDFRRVYPNFRREFIEL